METLTTEMINEVIRAYYTNLFLAAIGKEGVNSYKTIIDNTKVDLSFLEDRAIELDNGIVGTISTIHYTWPDDRDAVIKEERVESFVDEMVMTIILRTVGDTPYVIEAWTSMGPHSEGRWDVRHDWPAVSTTVMTLMLRSWLTEFLNKHIRNKARTRQEFDEILDADPRALQLTSIPGFKEGSLIELRDGTMGYMKGVRLAWPTYSYETPVGRDFEHYVAHTSVQFLVIAQSPDPDLVTETWYTLR